MGRSETSESIGTPETYGIRIRSPAECGQRCEIRSRILKEDVRLRTIR